MTSLAHRLLLFTTLSLCLVVVSAFPRVAAAQSGGSIFTPFFGKMTKQKQQVESDHSAARRPEQDHSAPRPSSTRTRRSVSGHPTKRSRKTVKKTPSKGFRFPSFFSGGAAKSANSGQNDPALADIDEQPEFANGDSSPVEPSRVNIVFGDSSPASQTEIEPSPSGPVIIGSGAIGTGSRVSRSPTSTVNRYKAMSSYGPPRVIFDGDLSPLPVSEAELLTESASVSTDASLAEKKLAPNTASPEPSISNVQDAHTDSLLVRDAPSDSPALAVNPTNTETPEPAIAENDGATSREVDTAAIAQKEPNAAAQPPLPADYAPQAEERQSAYASVLTRNSKALSALAAADSKEKQAAQKSEPSNKPRSEGDDVVVAEPEFTEPEVASPKVEKTEIVASESAPAEVAASEVAEYGAATAANAPASVNALHAQHERGEEPIASEYRRNSSLSRASSFDRKVSGRASVVSMAATIFGPRKAPVTSTPENSPQLGHTVALASATEKGGSPFQSLAVSASSASNAAKRTASRHLPIARKEHSRLRMHGLTESDLFTRHLHSVRPAAR